MLVIAQVTLRTSQNDCCFVRKTYKQLLHCLTVFLKVIKNKNKPCGNGKFYQIIFLRT